MRKKTFIISYISIVLLFTAGCKRNSSKLPQLNPKMPVNLTIWNYYTGHQKEAFDKIVGEFNDSVGREKGIIIESISQGGVNELAEKLLKAAKSDDIDKRMPDVFGAYSDTLYDLDKMNKVAALDQYISSSELDEYNDNFINEGRSLPGGQFKIFPIAKSTELLYVNKTDWDIFKQAVTKEDSEDKYKDVSDENLKTWEGIFDAGQVYYKWSEDKTPNIPNDGKALFGLDSFANFQLIGNKQLGVDLLSVTDGKGKLNIDKNIQRKIWDSYIKGISNGYFAAIGRFRSDDLKTGKILMYIGSSSSAPYTPTQVTFEDGKTYNIESMVLPLPVFKGGSKVAVQQGAGMAVKKSSAEKEYAAVLFLKYFTDINKNIDFVFDSSYLPIKKSGMDIVNTKNKLEDLKKSSSMQKSNMGISLEVSIKQMKEYSLYYAPPFAGSYNVRKVLENATLAFLDDIHKNVRNSVSSGSSFDNAILKATDEASFNLYLDQLQREINKEIK